MEAQEINRLHDESMDFAGQATAAERLGDHKVAALHWRSAFECERAAAEGVVQFFPGDVVIRAVLLRSAAALAKDCGEHAEAARLVALCRVGNPPAFIEGQLREIESGLNSGEASFVAR